MTQTIFLAPLILSVFLLTRVTEGGDLQPPGLPSEETGAMFTLTDLYQRMADGAPGVKNTNGFTGPASAPTNGVDPTLDDVMALLPNLTAERQAAEAADVPAGLQFWGLTADGWGLHTGTSSTAVQRLRGERVIDLSGSSPTHGGGSAVFTGDFSLDGRTATVVDAFASEMSVTSAVDGRVAFSIPAGTGTRFFTLKLNGEPLPAYRYLPAGNRADLGEIHALPFSYDPPLITSVSGGAYDIPPRTFGVTPFGGTTLTLSGSNFGTDIARISVDIGGVTGTVDMILVDHTQILMTTAADPSGGQDEVVRVTVDGLSGAQPYLSYSGPEIIPDSLQVNGSPTGIHGDFTTTDGSDVFEFEALNFDSAPFSVRYGPPGLSFEELPFEATILSHSSSHIECRAATGVGVGLIFQLKSGAQYSLPSTDTLSYPLPVLVADSLRLTEGGAGSASVIGTASDGERIYFNVSNLGTGTPLPAEWLTVTLGDPGGPFTQACHGVQLSHTNTLISCITPRAFGAGAKVFRIAVPQGASVEGTDQFFYPAGPILTNLSGCTDIPPATIDAPTAGGVQLTVRGSNFTASHLSVQIGDRFCEEVILHDSTRITCRLPPGAGPGRPVIVRCGSLASPAQPYLSYAPPVIASITSDGPSGVAAGATVVGLARTGGDTIVLRGSNFGEAGGQVLLGGMPCTNLVHDGAAPHDIIRVMTPPRAFAPFHDLPLILVDAAGQRADPIFYLSYEE